jgi:cation diffusion facilitator family transporter
MNHENLKRARAVQRVLLLTLAANLAVVVIKAVAGFSAHSLSVLADAAHSSVDAWSNLMAMTMARVASKAPDAEHPYGHEKFETLGALGIVAFLSIAVFQLLVSALGRLAGSGQQPHSTFMTASVMVLSAIVSFSVSRYEARAGRTHHSEILLADAAHTRTDVYSSIAVLLGLGLVALGFHEADAIVTLIVAIVIARVAWHILQDSVPILVDERALAEEDICRVTLSTPGVIDCFSVRSRGRAGQVFAELTITVRPTLNVQEAHHIADTVEQRIAGTFGAREVVVHVEPHLPKRDEQVESA